MKKTKIYIGVGHGGADCGAVGIGGVIERDINLSIAEIVVKGLENLGYNVITSRADNVTAKNTAAKVNEATAEGCDVMFDIHMNAFNGTASGCEVYRPSNYAPAKNVATDMCRNLAKYLNIRNRGEKTRTMNSNGKTVDYYGVTRFNGKYGGFLVEVCFIDNEGDMRKFNAGLAAAAILQTIEKFYL